MILPKISRYSLIEEIGRGGMATVYKAMQPSLNREVALKVLPAYFAHDEEFVERFRREALAVAKLRHPNIVNVHSFQQEGDVFYIVMEYIDGGSLHDRIERGTLTIAEGLEIASQVAGALQHAHSRGFVHRDIKPSNILLTKDGQAVLTDFGIVKALEGTSFTRTTDGGVGTTEYMSPEQAQGLAVDSRCDIYGLGTVLYEMLTGRTPFKADTPAAIIHQQIYEAVQLPRDVNPSISAGVEAIVLKCLSKEPDERFSSALELRTALQEAINDEESKALPKFQPQNSVTGIRFELRRLRETGERQPALGGKRVADALRAILPSARLLYGGIPATVLVVILIGAGPYLAVARGSNKVLLREQKLGNLILVRRELSAGQEGTRDRLIARVSLENTSDREISFVFRETLPKSFSHSASGIHVSVGGTTKEGTGPVMDVPVRISPHHNLLVKFSSLATGKSVNLLDIAESYSRGFARLKSIRLKTSQIVIKQGNYASPQVIGVLSDGSTVPVDARWSTSDSRVVAIRAGKLLGRSPGRASLTGEVDGRRLAAVCKVLPIEVSLQIRAESTQTVVGDRLPLVALVKLSDGKLIDVVVEWRSGDSNVGKMEKAVFLALKSGTTTIVARYKKFTARLSVAVADPPAVEEDTSSSAKGDVVGTGNSRSPVSAPVTAGPTAPTCSCGGLLCSCDSSGHGGACGGTADGRCRHAPEPRWCPAPHPSVPGAPASCPSTPGDLHLHQ